MELLQLLRSEEGPTKQSCCQGEPVGIQVKRLGYLKKGCDSKLQRSNISNLVHVDHLRFHRELKGQLQLAGRIVLGWVKYAILAGVSKQAMITILTEEVDHLETMLIQAGHDGNAEVS